MKPANAHLPRIIVRDFQRAVPVNTSALQKSAEKALRFCLGIRRTRVTQLKNLAEIHVLLISDRRMAALHRQFLGKSGPTDVITFDHGEIFISTETARRQARQFGNSFGRELRLYVVHGLLHLHGFDDRSAVDARRLAKEQNRIVEQLG